MATAIYYFAFAYGMAFMICLNEYKRYPLPFARQLLNRLHFRFETAFVLPNYQHNVNIKCGLTFLFCV